jgi:diguanylate cyclase (GGDEF)-like protein
MEQAAGQGAATAAEGLAAAIDGAWMEAIQPGTADVKYNTIKNLADKLVDQGYVHRVEVLRYVSPVENEYILSFPEDNSADYYRPGTKETVRPGTPYLEKDVGFHGVQMQKPGSYIAGWAPISNGDRNVGMLMLIVDGNGVQAAMNTINIALVVVLLALISLSGIVAYKFSASFEKAAVTDGLMGIYNHKYFKQRLEQEVAKSHRYAQQTSLVMLDIDYFKKVNDTFGHATGDLVLKLMARWVTDCSRNTDVVARYGGEEIGIILTHTGLAGAQEFAERLRLKISQQIIKDPEEDAEFRVTVSVGVAQAEKGVSMLDLIKRADAALYHSKRTGRNRVTIYQEDILPAPEPQPKTGS